MRATELLAIAEAEVGYIGKKSNSQLDEKNANLRGKYTKYARDLYEAGYYNGNKNGYDFCCVFVDWLFYVAAGRDATAAKAVKNCGIYGAGVNYVKGAMPGRIFDKPAVGDQVLFKDADGSLAHTGIVCAVMEDGAIQTIEGNVTGNEVAHRAYAADNPRIDSFIRPYYEAEPEPVPEPEPAPEGVTISAERYAELLQAEKVAAALDVLRAFWNE